MAPPHKDFTGSISLVEQVLLGTGESENCIYLTVIMVTTFLITPASLKQYFWRKALVNFVEYTEISQLYFISSLSSIRKASVKKLPVYLQSAQYLLSFDMDRRDCRCWNLGQKTNSCGTQSQAASVEAKVRSMSQVESSIRADAEFRPKIRYIHLAPPMLLDLQSSSSSLLFDLLSLTLWNHI